MKEGCNTCLDESLEEVYSAPDTLRELKIFLCKNCGLVQSLPRTDHVLDRTRRVTSGAAWGNVRYGKGFRAKFALEFMQTSVPGFSPSKILDVGANRGVFLKTLADEFSDIDQLVAVEPDSNVVDSYKDSKNIKFINDRIEKVDFGNMRFDFIHCSHTLEHLADPVKVLGHLSKLADSSDTLYYFEVPNLELISSADLLEEFFIDKHLYHYDQRSFIDLLRSVGYTIVENGFFSDSENLVAVCKFSSVVPKERARSPNEIDALLKKISGYAQTLEHNRGKLLFSAKKLNRVCAEKNIVFWGAGRIFDSLVTIGGLNPRGLYMLVDKYLSEFPFLVHGIEVEAPEKVKSSLNQIDCVIIASRTYLGEIEDELRCLGFDGRIIGYDHLIKEGFDDL